MNLMIILSKIVSDKAENCKFAKKPETIEKDAQCGKCRIDFCTQSPRIVYHILQCTWEHTPRIRQQQPCVEIGKKREAKRLYNISQNSKRIQI